MRQLSSPQRQHVRVSVAPVGIAHQMQGTVSDSVFAMIFDRPTDAS